MSADDDVTVALRNPFSSSISEMITTFSMSTYKVGLKVNPNEQDHRVPVLSWSTCAYTIQSIVSALVPDSQVENTLCILDIDMFHLLVYSVLSYTSVHSLDQSGRSVVDSAHLHLLHLVTVAHLVQILLTSATEDVCMDQDSAGSEEEEFTCQLYDTLRKHLGSLLPEESSGWQLWHCVKTGILPFLRAAALFFHYLNSTAPPADLLVAGPGQWEAVCSYLSLPSNLLQLYQSQHTLLEPLIHR
ncbi:E3 ubiquitin-protein ligase UBR2-like [Seriola lalandi dorsalis]|uniref:E3 ubiquitin-protein ligase UBR2-like n=1 Tax=Seriola lalandi dorsalis TaxID=1841481 RepID=UPI000C6F7F56|nr:E3 ubiquitin-protein ligase UBR2-like [Seriola lalandi dorsalis]